MFNKLILWIHCSCCEECFPLLQINKTFLNQVHVYRTGIFAICMYFYKGVLTQELVFLSYLLLNGLTWVPGWIRAPPKKGKILMLLTIP